ncbi:MAG: DUF421 domain-containing protein [Atopobiaceae bacterium]|nr:DUF421 domain-containing protein [Atopobiaceae bacterium]
MNFYLEVAIKLCIGLFSLVLAINVSGKGNLAPTAAIDQVQNFVLGGIVGGMIYNSAISILQYTLVLLIWLIIVLALKWLRTNNMFIKGLVDGKPIIVIDRGKLLVDNCRSAGLTAYDVSLKLRQAGVSYVSEVKRAILEQNGQLIIVQHGEENVKFPLITDGQVQTNILDAMDLEENWLENELKRQGYASSEIYLAEYSKGNLTITPYSD